MVPMRKWAGVAVQMGRRYAQWGLGFVVLGALVAGLWLGRVQSATAEQPQTAQPSKASQTLTLSASQMADVRVGQALTRSFVAESEALGSIDFDDDLTVQVFPNYSGKILRHVHELGDEVRQGETLYTIDSPDLIQAEATLISTAGVCALTTHALDRARQLLALQSLAEKDFQQAQADQQTAEANYQAARRALHLFGKSEADMDHILASRQIDSVLSVLSPLSGRVSVVALSAAAGTLVQPGVAPAPYAVSDLTALWLLANVAEADIPSLRVGAKVEIRVQAYPNKTFQAKIDKIGVALDPNTHRLTVRCVLRDKNHELHPGMMAAFTLHTGADSLSVAIPQGGLVREGDGSYSVWVMTEPRHFERRKIEVGVQQGDWVQILTGVNQGEMVVTEGAIYLSNALAVSSDSGH